VPVTRLPLPPPTRELRDDGDVAAASAGGGGGGGGSVWHIWCVVDTAAGRHGATGIGHGHTSDGHVTPSRSSDRAQRTAGATSHAGTCAAVLTGHVSAHGAGAPQTAAQDGALETAAQGGASATAHGASPQTDGFEQDAAHERACIGAADGAEDGAGDSAAGDDGCIAATAAARSLAMRSSDASDSVTGSSLSTSSTSTPDGRGTTSTTSSGASSSMSTIVTPASAVWRDRAPPVVLLNSAGILSANVGDFLSSSSSLRTANRHRIALFTRHKTAAGDMQFRLVISTRSTAHLQLTLN